MTDISLESQLPYHSPSSMIVSDVDENWLVVENVYLYGTNVTHPHVFVQKDMLRTERGDVKRLDRYESVRYCEIQGMVLPSMGVLCNVLVALHAAREKPFVKPVLAQFENPAEYRWHGTNTLIDWNNEQGEIIDYPSSSDFVAERGVIRGIVNSGLRQSTPFFVEGFYDSSLSSIVKRGHTPFLEYVQKLSKLEDSSLLLPLRKSSTAGLRVSVPLDAGRVKTRRVASLGYNSYDILYLDGIINIGGTTVSCGIRFDPPSQH